MKKKIVKKVNKGLGMVRLDKFLCDVGIGTRSEVKNYIKKGLVSLNGEVVRKPEIKVDADRDSVSYNGEKCTYVQYAYYMLNKPEGVISATRDRVSETVLDLLGNPGIKGLFPVGRLDKDTEGLLLITNDGMLSHELLSPKKHVDKVYYVSIKKKLQAEDIRRLETGVPIEEGCLSMPAKVEVLDEKEILLTIHEGKFHQVKKMLHAVDNEVLYLKRLSMGSLRLDESLAPGEFRPLTEEEVAALKGNKE